MKQQDKTIVPRNPFVSAAKFRQAGAFKQGNTRQQAKRELKRALKEAV